MTEQETGIIRDCVESIKILSNIAIQQVATKNICTEVERFKLYQRIIIIAGDTIDELEKVGNGAYEPKDRLGE